MKRLLSIILAICLILGMVLALLPAANAAAVDTMKLYVNEPQFGMSVDSGFLYCTNSDPEIEVSGNWYAEGSDPWTDAPVTGTFGGGTYTLMVFAGGLPPMGLQDLKKVTLNGKIVDDWCFTDDLCNDIWFMVTYTLEAKTLIDTANLTLNAPQIGDNIADCEIQAPEDAPYTASSYWYDDTDGRLVDAGTFQEGHTYQLIFGVYPKDGYAIHEDTRLYVNGKDDIYYYVELGSMSISGFAQYTIREPLQPGDVNGDGLISGADAYYLLRCILFPQRYETAANCDFDGNNIVTDDDAYYLLRHTLFPTIYPIS